jgi:hypothetical protein
MLARKVEAAAAGRHPVHRRGIDGGPEGVRVGHVQKGSSELEDA